MANSTYKTVFLWVIKILTFVIPFVPLVIAKDMFFPFITPKALLFRTIVEICFVGWIFLAFFYREYRPRLNALAIAIAIFITVVSLATIFGVNPDRSFWSNFERMEGLVTYLHLAAYFLVVAHIFERKDWIIFFNLFVVSGIIENFYVFSQKLGFIASPQGGVRVDGTIGNSTYLAAYLIFVLGFAAILFIHAKNRGGKIFYGLASLFSLMSIYFTATRGAMLALLIAGFIFLSIYLWLVKTDTARGRLHRKIGLYVLGTLFAIPVLFLLFKNTSFVASSPVLGRFRNLSLDDARYYIWQMGWEGFKEHPVLGWGPENFGIVFSKYYRPELYAQEPWFDRAHNIALDWLVNAGALGLVSYLAIFITAFYLLWENYKKNKTNLEVMTVIAILLAVYFLQNLFVFDNIATYLSFFTILAYIYNMSVFEDPLSGDAKHIGHSRHFGYKPVMDLVYAPLVLMVLILPLTGILYRVNLKPYMANISLLNAIKVRTIQEVDGGFAEFKRALSYDTLGDQEIREQVARFAEIVTTTQGVPDDKKMEIFRFALEETDKGAKENPADPRPLLFFSALLVRASLTDQALLVLNDALRLSPNKQQIYFEIGDIYLKNKNYVKAVEILEKAWELEPRFLRASVNLIAALVLAGENARADEYITRAFPDGVGPEPILIQVYKQTGDLKRLLLVQKAFVMQSPDNWDARRDVIDTLIALGRRSEAVSYLENLIKEKSQLKTDAENFLRQM